ncbi:2-deoxystreptamine glucosyltransferase [Corynebacterium aurimucosum]|nr:2-deoxystreptamine glucosyltransferase [Corynebacterium aurimucosum]
MIRASIFERGCSLSCMVTFSIQQLMIDPLYFLERVLRRFSYSGQGLYSALTELGLEIDQTEALRKSGCYRDYLSTIESSRVRRIARHFTAKDVKEELEELTIGFTPSIRGSISQNSNMRILHYLTNSKPYTKSGYTERTESVLKAQSWAGLQPMAVTRLGYPAVIGKNQVATGEQQEEISVRHLIPAVFPWSRKRYRELAVRKLVQMIESEAIDVLHTTSSFKNALIVSEAAKISGIPWVYEVRGQLESTWLSKLPEPLQSMARHSDKYRCSQAQEIRAMNAAGGVVLLSETQRAALKARGLRNENISVIPNALDEKIHLFETGSSWVRKSLGLEGKRVVGIVTSVVAYEGIETLIEAGAAANNRPVLLIVGDGDDLPRLKQLARQFGIEDRVIFPGRVGQEEILDWYAAMDIFVVPRIDSEVTRLVTPLKSLKAQALGIPVIASDLPALREVTGGHAQYFEAGNAQELTRLLENMPAVSREARRFAAGRSWKANGQKYKDLYSKL